MAKATPGNPDWQPAKSPSGQPSIEKRLEGGVTLAVMQTPDGTFRAAARLVVTADTLEGAKAAAENAGRLLLAPLTPAPAVNPPQAKPKPKPNPVAGLERKVDAAAAAAAEALGWQRKKEGNDKKWLWRDGRAAAHITLSPDGWVWMVEVDGAARESVDTRTPCPTFAAAAAAAGIAAEGGAEAIIARSDERRAATAAAKAVKAAAFAENAAAAAAKKDAKREQRRQRQLAGTVA